MNNRNDFDKMFREWYAPFFYFACHYVKDSEACKDIVSETFESLWKNYRKITPETAKAYLMTIVKAKCIDYLRRQGAHDNYLKYVSILASTDTENGMETEPDRRITALHEAMGRLTPYNRHILEQCYIHRKRYKEVAEELQVSVAAVHKNIVKALRVLRKELLKR